MGETTDHALVSIRPRHLAFSWESWIGKVELRVVFSALPRNLKQKPPACRQPRELQCTSSAFALFFFLSTQRTRWMRFNESKQLGIAGNTLLSCYLHFPGID